MRLQRTITTPLNLRFSPVLFCCLSPSHYYSTFATDLQNCILKASWILLEKGYLYYPRGFFGSSTWTHMPEWSRERKECVSTFLISFTKTDLGHGWPMGFSGSSFLCLPSHTHTQRCWCWQEGIKQTWQLGCFQLVASQLLWCRFPGRAWLALQSGISAVTTN